MSYELTIDVTYDTEGNEHRILELHPGEIVFIKTQEKLSIPEESHIASKRMLLFKMKCNMLDLEIIKKSMRARPSVKCSD